MTRSLIALSVLALAAASPLRAQGIPALGAAKAAAQKAANATNANIAEQTGQAVPNRNPGPAMTTAAAPAGKSSGASTKPAATPNAQPASQPAAQPAKGAAQPASQPAKGAAQPASQPAAKQPAAPAPATASPAVKPLAKDTVKKGVTKDTTNKGAAAAPPEVAFSREVFTYTGDGRRDPFLSLLATGDLRPAYSDLRLVGVVYDPTGRKSVAVMRDVGSAAHDQYRVKVGQTLGRMRVTSIHPKSVTFTIDEFGYSRQEVLALGDSTQRNP